MKKVIIIFIVWRFLLFLPLWIGKDIPYRIRYEYTHIFTSTLKYHPVDHPLLYPWANFDGVHYLDIAGNGYKDNGRFFPLYPLLIRGLSALFGTGKAFGVIQFFCALFIGNFAFFLAVIFLYKLLRLDFSEKISFWSIIFLILFPAGFFFATVYTEGLFLLFLVLSFYFARKNKWLLAGIPAMLLSITRPVGLLIIPSLIYEFIKQKKYLKSNLSFCSSRFAVEASFFIFYFLFFISSGLILFSYFCYLKWHDPLYFFHAQALVKNSRTVAGFIFPLQTVYRYLKILITVSPKIYEWWIALLEFVSFWFAGYLLIVGWLKKIRPSYMIFSTLAFIVPTISGTFSALPRYILVLFPIFVALALIKNRLVKIIYVIVGVILQFVLLMLFSRGYFIA